MTAADFGWTRKFTEYRVEIRQTARVFWEVCTFITFVHDVTTVNPREKYYIHLQFYIYETKAEGKEGCGAVNQPNTMRQAKYITAGQLMQVDLRYNGYFSMIAMHCQKGYENQKISNNNANDNNKIQ